MGARVWQRCQSWSDLASVPSVAILTHCANAHVIFQLCPAASAKAVEEARFSLAIALVTRPTIRTLRTHTLAILRGGNAAAPIVSLSGFAATSARPPLHHLASAAIGNYWLHQCPSRAETVPIAAWVVEEIHTSDQVCRATTAVEEDARPLLLQ